MADVLVRYWAAARAAAGVAEERLAGATLAEVVAAARAAHGVELGRVLDRCAYLVDEVRARPETPLSDGAVVEVLPPFAGGAQDQPSGAVGGLLCLLLAATCVLAALSGPRLLAVSVLLVQLVFAAAWFPATGLPGGGGGMLVAGGAAVAVDALLLVRGPQPAVVPVVWVLGPALLAAFAAQLARRDGRPLLVPSLTATVLATVMVCLGALLVPALDLRGATVVVGIALAGVALGALAATLPLVARLPPLLRAVLGGGAAAAAGWALAALARRTGDRTDIADAVRDQLAGAASLDPSAGAGIAGAGGLLAVGAVLVARGPSGRTGPPERSGGALLAVTASLPLLVAGPAAYVLGLVLV